MTLFVGWQFADSQGERVATATHARPSSQVWDGGQASDVCRTTRLRQRHVHDIITDTDHLRHRSSV